MALVRLVTTGGFFVAQRSATTASAHNASDLLGRHRVHFRLGVASSFVLTYVLKLGQAGRPGCHNRAKRRRSELAMTDTELKLIAAAATIGLSNSPNAG